MKAEQPAPQQVMPQPVAESRLEKPATVPEPESEPIPRSRPKLEPKPAQKQLPSVKVPGFLASYEGGAAAYKGHLFPAYLRLSKILGKTLKEHTLGKLHSKVQREIKHLKDFSGDDEIREEVLTKFVRQLAVHVLEYEARASANLRKKEPEMKAVSQDDIDYMVSCFEFRPWDRQ